MLLACPLTTAFIALRCLSVGFLAIAYSIAYGSVCVFVWVVLFACVVGHSVASFYGLTVLWWVLWLVLGVFTVWGTVFKLSPYSTK
jgi:hypothetical protein